jgi:hypothetical protein
MILITIITMILVTSSNDKYVMMVRTVILKVIMIVNDETVMTTIFTRYYKEIAEIYEADGNMEGAIESFQQAANLFVGRLCAYLHIRFVYA